MYEDVKGAETALRTLTNTELDGRKIFLRKVGWLMFIRPGVGYEGWLCHDWRG